MVPPSGDVGVRRAAVTGVSAGMGVTVIKAVDERAGSCRGTGVPVMLGAGVGKILRLEHNL